MTGSWDPELGLVYFGTAQAKPWVAASRGLTTADSTAYANSTLALRVEDGSIAWYYIHVPGESLDMDEALERVLLDVNGEPTVISIGKHGILWKLDRRDGEFLGLTETVYQNILNIDYNTGAVEYREDIANAKVDEWLSVLSLDGWRPQLARERIPPGVAPSGHAAQPELHGDRRTGRRSSSPVPAATRATAPGWRCPARTATTASWPPMTWRPSTMVWSIEQRSPFLTAGPHHRRRPGLRRRLRPLDPRLRRAHRRGPVAEPPGHLGHGIPDFLRGRRRAVRGRGDSARGGGSPWRIPTFLTPELVRSRGPQRPLRLQAEVSPEEERRAVIERNAGGTVPDGARRRRRIRRMTMPLVAAVGPRFRRWTAGRRAPRARLGRHRGGLLLAFPRSPAAARVAAARSATRRDPVQPRLPAPVGRAGHPHLRGLVPDAGRLLRALLRLLQREHRGGAGDSRGPGQLHGTGQLRRRPAHPLFSRCREGDRRHWGVFTVTVPSNFGDGDVVWHLRHDGRTYSVPGTDPEPALPDQRMGSSRAGRVHHRCCGWRTMARAGRDRPGSRRRR